MNILGKVTPDLFISPDRFEVCIHCIIKWLKVTPGLLIDILQKVTPGSYILDDFF
jgi:hypothetical protein